MPRWAQLQDLAPGARLYLPVQIASMTATSITITVLAVNLTTGQVNPAPAGTFTINLQTSQVTGQWSSDPGGQPAWVQAEPLAVGDLLQGADGAVVRAATVGLGADGTHWSPYPGATTGQSQEGWTVVGHLDFP